MVVSNGSNTPDTVTVASETDTEGGATGAPTATCMASLEIRLKLPPVSGMVLLSVPGKSRVK